MHTRLPLAALALLALALPSFLGSRAGSCAAGEPPCAPPCAPPCGATMTREEAGACCRAFFDDYVPAVPVGPTRTMFTTLVMPPVPWLLTEGEAGTPRCGRVGFNLARISDERAFTDNNGNRFKFDGEEQVATLEVVSPELHVSLGGCPVPFHLAGSLTAYTLNFGWYDGLRNFVEGDIIGWSAAIRDAHRVGGRELSVTDASGNRQDLLASDPMWKARGVLKVPLPSVPVGCHHLDSAVSLGVTAPSFGSHSDSGNESVEADLTLALALPLSEHFRLTGAANLAVPGRSRKLEDLGIDHQTLVAGGQISLEWWVSHRVAIALGVLVNGPYTRSSGMPTDLVTGYVNLGVLWRPSERSEVHLLFSENPETGIAVEGTPSTSYSGAQKDADFSLTFGGSIDF